MLRVLLTGSNGFLGKHLCTKLSSINNIELFKLVRNLDGNKNTSIKCDLTDVCEVKGMLEHVKPDLILHAAAFVPKTLSDYESDSSAQNVMIVENILKHSTAKFINISSMTVYGSTGKVVRSELDSVAPETAYGKSKFQVEALLKNKRFSSLSIRIPGLFGKERRSGLVFNVFEALHSKKQPSLPETSLLWAAMDVDDAAEAIVNVALSWSFNECEHNAINVGYRGIFSINSFLEIAEQLFNTTIPYDVVHPQFEFDLALLDSLNATPEKIFKEVLFRLKRDYGF